VLASKADVLISRHLSIEVPTCTSELSVVGSFCDQVSKADSRHDDMIETYDAVWCSDGFCFAIQLVSVALDVVHPVCHDNDISSNIAFDGRAESGAGVLLFPSCIILASIDTE